MAKLSRAIVRIAMTGAATFAAFAGTATAGERAKPVAASAVPVVQTPRNIIFVLVDDLRYDGMGFLQPGLLKTPNIDRMAKEGSYFPNAVVTSSLCSPSRATILTGQTARNHRIVDNNDSSEAALTFFPSYLQQAGYQTAFFGKWHMGAATDAPRPGFTKWVSFKGQGTYWPQKGASAESGDGATLNVDGKEVARTGYITDELTDYAMNWLTKERDPSKPFFLYLSHKGVHSDPLPPPRYAHQYDNVKFSLPASAADTPANYAGKPRWVHDQRNTWHGIEFFYNSDVPMTEYLRYYYGTLSAIDDSLGRIMDYLRKNKMDKNTLVVFTSDNGYMIGEHGLIDKRNAYQASVRVPLVVWEPGTVPAGKVNDGRVRNLDFAPTFLEVAGVTRPQHFEGQSAWSLWNGTTQVADWKPGDFVYEYFWEYNFPMTPTTFAITRGDLKYIQYHGIYDIDELYDLSKDPEEMVNLADDPSYSESKRTLRDALFQQLANRQGEHLIPYMNRRSIGAVRRMKGGTGAAPFPDSWYIKPNPTDRFDNIVPDSAAKDAAHAAGKPLTYTPPLNEELRRQMTDRGH
ncbi:sulfatase [Sphingobium sp. DEHP117]|uniref:sulfatase family protein n=1 Tax=Sphingobium sp. DEHP117 TaxID=2993436 RepID=UPI0027D4DBA2|nr:sulfatase-like hydrolase/transferase [Sphingobium sp. DEHP117]MDQ4421540.1 sulfatase [Sphingobium sp. DEHP117]